MTFDIYEGKVGKNTHMVHIEDLSLYGGVNGVREAIFALKDLRDMFGGHHDNRISVKWDGAPAIFAGIDPRDKKFFVAKKGIFNKSPKVYKTAAEVNADTEGDLAKKLSAALEHLPHVGIKGVIQGDFLYHKSDLKKQRIDGEQYITFQPNTIVYAIPIDQAAQIWSSEIGIVWHTTYKGSSFENMKASYGVDVAALKPYKKVWMHDATLKSLTGITLGEEETAEVNEHISNAGRIFNRISGSTLRELENDQTLAQEIEQFNNTFVRAGQSIGNTKTHTTKLINWMSSKYKKEVAARSTPASKKVWQDKHDDRMKFFSVKNRKSLEGIFELQKSLVAAKNVLINKLNDMKSYDTFIKTSNGYKVTKDEGYVVIDNIGSDAVKLVDRLEFSYNNFSPDVIKGWQSNRR